MNLDLEIHTAKKCNRVNLVLIIILFILLNAFSILIRFLKKIARQNMLVVQINKSFLASCFYFTAQKRKFSIKDFFSKYDQISSFLRF